MTHEVERVPIKVEDFYNDNSITRKYMFHSLIFSWEPTFRFKSDRLLMLGFLMCSHRTQKHARDSLWGLINPYVKPVVPKDNVKDFMITLVDIATKLPWDYYQGLETKTDMALHTFL